MIKFGTKIKTGNTLVKYHITADLHFGHKNVMKFCPKTRPWDTIEEMEDGLISHWNSTVSPDDVVFVLGDMFFGSKEDISRILHKLNGEIVHLYGNHAKVLRNQFKLNAYDYLEVRYNNVHIVMNHYAQRVWNRAHYGAVHLYGHSHGGLNSYGRSMDVGWDAHGRILSLDEAVEMCLTKDIEIPDQH